MVGSLGHIFMGSFYIFHFFYRKCTLHLGTENKDVQINISVFLKDREGGGEG